jgi:hypothetical protein
MTTLPFPRHTDRPRRRRRFGGWFAVAAWLWSVSGAGALETLATTRIVAVEGSEVVLGAGRSAGLAVTSEVTLLREAEPIIHPLTGEVLGVPQEPVGLVQVFEVGEASARGNVVKVYSAPREGDLAEYQPVAAAPAPAPEVSSVLREFEELRATVEQVRARDDDMRSYPAFARKVWDEVSAMRSYLTSIDQRLVELEEQQSEDHFRLSSVINGEFRQQDYKEFTVRYAPDTEVRLRAAGKTLLIEVVGDSLQVMEEMAAPMSMAAPKAESGGGGLLAMLGLSGSSDEEEDPAPMVDEVPVDDMTDGTTPWYQSVYHLGAGVGLTLAMLIMLFLVIRRRYTDVMDGLEDFDEYEDEDYDSFLEDDEDEDEDDDR